MTSEAETSYRSLCSLETLRSGSKGFFRDFSENVIRVVGEQWIGKVFGRLASDEDRVRAVFTDVKAKDTVLETLNRTEILYRGKDASVSRARRLEGFEAAAAGRHRDALLLFGQAVLRAPSLGFSSSLFLLSSFFYSFTLSRASSSNSTDPLSLSLSSLFFFFCFQGNATRSIEDLACRSRYWAEPKHSSP